MKRLVILWFTGLCFIACSTENNKTKEQQLSIKETTDTLYEETIEIEYGFGDEEPVDDYHEAFKKFRQLFDAGVPKTVPSEITNQLFEDTVIDLSKEVIAIKEIPFFIKRFEVYIIDQEGFYLAVFNTESAGAMEAITYLGKGSGSIHGVKSNDQLCLEGWETGKICINSDGTIITD